MSDYEPSPPRVLLFTGYAGAGKTTAAGFACTMQNSRRPGSAAAFSLAEPLRELCTQMFPDVPLKNFYGDKTDKEAPLAKYPGWSGRRILQHIGTEGYRAIDPQIWVRLLRRKIEALPKTTRVVTVDDVRFPDEVEGLRSLPNAALVRVSRAGSVRGTHVSETHIDYFEADVDIDNNHEKFALETRVRKILFPRE